MREQMQLFPDRVITEAVRGMMPKTKLGRAQMKKLKVYAGPEHPHVAQQPKTLDL
jgi:large subunit ribosomal protein L13